MIITISRNPEHFGSFDGEGNYNADEEKVMQALKYGGITEEESQKYKLGMTALLGCICLITWGIMIRNKRKDHTGQKTRAKIRNSFSNFTILHIFTHNEEQYS